MKLFKLNRNWLILNLWKIHRIHIFQNISKCIFHFVFFFLNYQIEFMVRSKKSMFKFNEISYSLKIIFQINDVQSLQNKQSYRNRIKKCCQILNK